MATKIGGEMSKLEFPENIDPIPKPGDTYLTTMNLWGKKLVTPFLTEVKEVVANERGKPYLVELGAPGETTPPLVHARLRQLRRGRYNGLEFRRIELVEEFAKDITRMREEREISLDRLNRWSRLKQDIEDLGGQIGGADDQMLVNGFHIVNGEVPIISVVEDGRSRGIQLNTSPVCRIGRFGIMVGTAPVRWGAQSIKKIAGRVVEQTSKPK